MNSEQPPMYPPLLIAEDLEGRFWVSCHESPEAVTSQLEPWYVEEDYRAFDATGQSLELFLREPPRRTTLGMNLSGNEPTTRGRIGRWLLSAVLLVFLILGVGFVFTFVFADGTLLGFVVGIGLLVLGLRGLVEIAPQGVGQEVSIRPRGRPWPEDLGTLLKRFLEQEGQGKDLTPTAPLEELVGRMQPYR